jgi:hypothetical protein
MQPAEYSPSSSPRGASSSLAFSEIPSVSSALDADVVSLEDDDTESSRSSSPHPSSPAFPEVSSAPSALGADVVSLENGNTDESTAVVTGSFDLSGEVPASLPSVLATGVAQRYHLDLSDRFLGVPDNSLMNHDTKIPKKRHEKWMNILISLVVSSLSIYKRDRIQMRGRKML